MEDNNDIGLSYGFIPLVISISLLLLSSIGAFDTLLSISAHLQSHYQIRVSDQFAILEEAIGVSSNVWDVTKERDSYQEEVIALKEEIANLKAQLRDDNILSLQESSFDDSNRVSIPARVIRYNQEFPGTMLINKGSRDGVKQDDVVVLQNFALAEITSVSKYTCIARTLISSESKIPVISDEGAKGVLVSRSGSELEVGKVLTESVVKEGDVFVTLGINSNFPANLYVGKTVNVVSNAADTSKTIKLQNDIDFGNLREVFILTHKEE